MLIISLSTFSLVDKIQQKKPLDPQIIKYRRTKHWEREKMNAGWKAKKSKQENVNLNKSDGHQTEEFS